MHCLPCRGSWGDSTSVLSKEWQALTPRASSCTSGGSSVTLPHACLDSLLDGIAELSTSVGDGSVRSGTSNGTSSSGSGMLGFGGRRSPCSAKGSPFGGRSEPCDSPPRTSSQHTSSGLQVGSKSQVIVQRRHSMSPDRQSAHHPEAAHMIPLQACWLTRSASDSSQQRPHLRRLCLLRGRHPPPGQPALMTLAWTPSAGGCLRCGLTAWTAAAAAAAVAATSAHCSDATYPAVTRQIGNGRY